ncbi:MAG: hypothetical protein RR365_00965 [Bacteroides sp.]
MKEHIFPDPLKREAYKNRKEIEELEVELSIEESQNAAMSYASDCPHCPTCGSSSVEKIGGLERGVSVVVLGIFSKKINKSYKCRNCGHTW